MYYESESCNIIHLKVKCFNDDCDNILEHKYPSDYGSPRVDGICEKCGKGYSKKVHNIEGKYIVEKTSTSINE